LFLRLYPLCGAGIFVSCPILIITSTSAFVKVLLPHLARFYFRVWQGLGSFSSKH